MLATQNPIEQEGTYALPEAQVDRFMLKLKVGYPGPRSRSAPSWTRRPSWAVTDFGVRPTPVADAEIARARTQRHRTGLRRRQDQGLHRRRGERHARSGGVRTQGPRRSHPIRRQPTRDSIFLNNSPRKRARFHQAPRLRHARRHQEPSAPTCCATGSPSPTRPRPRRSRPRTWSGASSTHVEVP